MKTNPPLFLGIDIETLPGERKEYTLSLPTKPTSEDIKLGNVKDQAKIDAKIESELHKLIDKWEDECLDAKLKMEESFRKQALDSMSGKIFIISFAFDDMPIVTLYNEDEKQLLDSFADALADTQNPMGLTWYGHNIKGFDLPFLFHKALLHNSKLLKYIPRSIRSKFIEDTATMFGMDKYGVYYKLSNIAKFLGIDGKYEGIDGGMVYDLWLDGKIDDLKLYCADDVRITRSIFKLLNVNFKTITNKADDHLFEFDR